MENRISSIRCKVEHAIGDEKPAQAVLAWLFFDFCL